MLFYGRYIKETLKNCSSLLKKLELGIASLREGSDTLNQRISSIEKNGTEQAKAIEDVKKAIRKQSVTFEDYSEESNKALSALREAEKELSLYGERESRYIGLIHAYMDAFQTIKRGLGDRDDWSGALEGLQEQLIHEEYACGFMRIEDEGVPLDYDRHEVLSVLPTDEKALDKTIAKIHRIGCIADGNVRIKALVSVYRHSEFDLSNSEGPKSSVF